MLEVGPHMLLIVHGVVCMNRLCCKVKVTQQYLTSMHAMTGQDRHTQNRNAIVHASKVCSFTITTWSYVTRIIILCTKSDSHNKVVLNSNLLRILER